MKKIGIVLIGFLLIFLSSCSSRFHWSEGAYELTEIRMTEEFTNGKLNLTYLTKKEFEKADGINVLEIKTSMFNYYYKIELILYSVISQQEEFIQISNLYYHTGRHRCYGEAYLKVKGKEYKEEVTLVFSSQSQNVTVYIFGGYFHFQFIN